MTIGTSIKISMENKKVKTFRDIIAWQKSHELVLKIYSVTRKFPKEERFGLISQMRRSAVSVAANIVEGFARKNRKEALPFYNISNASLEELKYHILIFHDLNLIDNNNYSELSDLANESGRVLQAWSISNK